MGADRPRFGRQAPPAVRSRVAAMAALLLGTAGLLALTRWMQPAPPPGGAPLVVEVRGEVPAPGFHALQPPLRVHAALAAAGADPAGFADAALEPGTRLVVDGRSVRLEPMDDLLVVGLPVDVNRAGAAALQAIPGLGPKRAADIVAERAAGGPYASVDDLQRVRGIGPATVDDLRPFVTAGASE